SWTVIHPDRPVKAKTRRSGFYEEVKLTDKPLSFWI
ncbi:hypothetical protein SEEPBA42_20386, partial [Salmonella enterica subsp. enterica serovar Paratyphi B str. SARA42]